MTSVVDTAQIQALDSAHYLHPFTDFKDLAARGARVMTRAQDIYVWDSDGQRVLDAMSGLWCVNVGYGRKELADVAHRQMMSLPYYNSFFQTTHVPAVQLAAKLAQLAPRAGPRSYEYVFYSSGGSESNDSNVRMVRRYWELLGQPQRKVIISRLNAYHGSTLAAASLSGTGSAHEQGDWQLQDIAHIGQPYFFENAMPGESEAEFGLRAARWLEERILELGAERVAAFIAEPVQGAGGVIVPPASYWPEIQRIVDQYGILLISDEVICAFGRLGSWFGYEKFGYRPDLVTFAKAVTSGYIPLAGVLVGDRVAQVLIERGGEFSHGYTYSGHPVACAVALANLDILEREGLPERVRDDIGPYLARRLAEVGLHPLVGRVDSCGFMAGLLLLKDKQRGEPFAKDKSVGMICRGHCFRNGLIMRAVGDRMIIAPPLTMTHSQIDEMIALMLRCIDLTYDDVARNGWLD